MHLYNHPEVQIKFSELKSKTIGKLVSIRGTVTRVARVMPFAKSLTFTCDKCDASQVVHLVDGKYAEPESCVGQGCRGRKFTANRESVKLVDWQKIRIQELSRDVPAEDIGRIPRFADVEVEGTLCDACRGGGYRHDRRHRGYLERRGERGARWRGNERRSSTTCT